MDIFDIYNIFTTQLPPFVTFVDTLLCCILWIVIGVAVALCFPSVFMASPICPTSCEKIHYNYSSINYSNHINNNNSNSYNDNNLPTNQDTFLLCCWWGRRQSSVIYPTRNQHNDRPGHGELVRLANYEPVSRCNSQTGYRSAHPSCSRDTAGQCRLATATTLLLLGKTTLHKIFENVFIMVNRHTKADRATDSHRAKKGLCRPIPSRAILVINQFNGRSGRGEGRQQTAVVAKLRSSCVMLIGGTPLLFARGQSFGGKTTSHVLWPCCRTCLVNAPNLQPYPTIMNWPNNAPSLLALKKKETKRKKQHENNMKIEQNHVLQTFSHR